MGSISIVHGIILVEDINLYKKVINSLNIDENYPWIRPEMWNLCGEERPYYYANPIATFGATYKNLDGGVSWSEFILKFENILSQIKFDFARIRLETEFMGDYEFFWGAKKNLEIEFYPKDLIECNKWFFGFGRRDMFGGISEEKPSLPFEFQFPIEFNREIKEKFNALIPELNKIELNTKVYFTDIRRHIVFGNDHSSLILTYLKIHKMIHYGWEHEKGLYMVRLDEINEINTPYSSK